MVAVGCLVQRHGEELQREIPEVDLFLGLTELPSLVPRLRSRGLLPEENDFVPVMERPLRVLSTETPHTSYLKISEGCDHTCAFCAIPLMRGLHRSHPVEELVREAAGLGAAGVKELHIVSQDTTWYGRDLRRKDRSAPLLQDLLTALLEGTEVPWYQHGSDRILEAMRRPERQKTIRERVGWLRDAIPGLTLRTTVIVGFPGETDDDFRDMLDLLEEIAFERVGAFTYSVEEGTRAADMPGQVPQDVMEERLEEVMELQRGISFDRNLELVGSTATVLVDQRVDGDPDFTAVGRTAGQAVDVDGVTHLRATTAVSPGDMVEARIVEAMDYDLLAEVME